VWAAFAVVIALSITVTGCGPEGGANVQAGLSADDVQRISVIEAKSLLDRGEAVLYDTRDSEWYESEHTAGAMSLPERDVPAQVDTLPDDKALIFY